ncbi:MAG: DUF1499 domain-containing protein [Pseudomonadota bacterium]
MKFFKSKKGGLVDGLLATCPTSPNCVVSETHARSAQAIDPISFSQLPADAWNIIQDSIRQTGGSIQSVDDEYLHATYTSKVMRYVDDVELRLDSNSQQIHMRSVSRVGYSDMGANRKRMERVRKAFNGQ